MNVKKWEGAPALVQEFEDGHKIESDSTGWETKYRLRLGDRWTEWGRYEDGLMLDGQVALSPYHTEFDTYILCTPVEACQYLCVQEDK